MSTNEHEMLCPSCGGKKQLFLERSWPRLAFSVLALAAIFYFHSSMPSSGTSLAFIYIGGAIGAAPAVTLIRIKCLKCEPEWQERGIWGGKNG